jgi:peptidoglycan glycosyltransferase
MSKKLLTLKIIANLILLIVLVLGCCFSLSAAQPESLNKKTATKKSTTSAKSKVAKKVPAKTSNTKSKVKIYKAGKKSKVKYASAVSLPSSRAQLTPKFISTVQSPTDPQLEITNISSISSDNLSLSSFPKFSTAYRGRVAGLTNDKSFVLYSIDYDLQEYAKQIIEKVPAPHVAIVAMEPNTGRVLAVAGKSISLDNIITHAGFPAASLIKSLTAAAAIEHGGMNPNSEIFFRGGTYELSERNYDPRPTDRNSFSAAEALGKSCNPVFSRIALKYLNPSLFRSQVALFGFNNNLRFQAPLELSSATVPNNDFEYGRAAAGFGDIYISPIHAAVYMSAFANQGKVPRPAIVDKVINSYGETLFEFEPEDIRRAIQPNTAKTMMDMMTATTTMGTSRREFAGRVPWNVAAKTGTLKGNNPKGLNNWFIGAAPAENPKLAVAVIVVNPSQISSKASHLGRLILERYLG